MCDIDKTEQNRTEQNRSNINNGHRFFLIIEVGIKEDKLNYTYKSRRVKSLRASFESPYKCNHKIVNLLR